MTHYIDVFNGDADGLCALVQLRRAEPQCSQLVTGIKRDINLLKQVDPQTGGHITVLDISFDKNRVDVRRLLDGGCTIDYIDHHKTGELVTHPRLQTDIDLSANTCTSLIVDRRLQGRFRSWAITAAFGDNLTGIAHDLGIKSGLSDVEVNALKQLGVCLNYNGYGACLDDLFFDPAELYKKLVGFDCPFEFIEHQPELVGILKEGYHQDLSKAKQISSTRLTAFSELFILPNEKWARRVSGVFANMLATQTPDKAHAILIEQDLDSYLVSIRAPLNRKQGADVVASQFPTGGGRKAAAGINALVKNKLETFIDVFEKQFILN